MEMNNELISKSLWPFRLKEIDKHRNTIIVVALLLASCFLLIFDKQQFYIKLALLIPMLFFTIVARYMIYFILWLQHINPFCPTVILNIFTWLFIVASVIGIVVGLVSIPISYFYGSENDILCGFLAFPASVSSAIGAVRFKIKNNIKSKSKNTKKPVLIITVVIALFLSLCVVAAECGIKSSEAYKQTISYIKNDPTIRKDYGEVTAIGFIATGGVEEQSENGEWSGDANIKLHFKTNKGSFYISAFLTRDSYTWQVVNYNIH
jgi:hypothetical protein